MTFTPVIGGGGLAGFRLLERSSTFQRAAFERSPEIRRNIEYFSNNIANVQSAEDLVRDRRLLTVALGAFGLGDEINKGAFLRRVLESNTADPRSFARRVADSRLLEFARTFGFGDLTNGTNVQLNTFRNDIVRRYQDLEFERAVGRADGDIRLALNFRREIAQIANGENADNIGVLQVLGQRPVREVLTTALGLPASLGRLDIDRQRAIIEQRLERTYGSSSVATFSDARIVEDTIRRFFAVRQTQTGAAGTLGGGGQFSLLSNQGAGSGGGINLLLSNS